MQKLINGVALLSGLVSLSIVGGGAYLYMLKDALIESATAAATKAATEAVTSALPGMLDAAMPEVPELPSATGGALPF
ncbi:plasmid stability [Synechococcus phage S-MbCM6]|uniref:Plasmid stability protein n=1 Tax=Synechococcus phage S-MbCM6 TaxID=3126011 RepID=H8ZMQ3_9CAUD|nr:plasmid stability [Synechococcus phage ACG-2014c]AFD02764.1 plasmid stability protein [Synechococcus phage ACG-2014c]